MRYVALCTSTQRVSIIELLVRLFFPQIFARQFYFGRMVTYIFFYVIDHSEECKVNTGRKTKVVVKGNFYLFDLS